MSQLASWETARAIGRIGLEAAGVDLGEAYEALIDRFADHLIGPGCVVIDGGANTGRHTIAFARRAAPGGIVYAFEPLADLVEANRAWARGDGLEEVVRYHALGLSDVAGEASFLRNITDPAYSSRHFDFPGTRTEAVRVPFDTLDRLFPEGCVDFVKMDTEGSEYAAFLGGERLLARSRPFMVFENALDWAGTCFGYSREDFFALFARLRLDLFDAFGRPFTPAQWDAPDVGWYFYAVPPERLAHEVFCDLAVDFWQSRLAAAHPVAAPSKPVLPAAAVAMPAPLPAHLLERARLLSSLEHLLHELPKGATVCQVGVALGDFSERILALCDVSRLIAIDTFTLDRAPDVWSGKVGAVLGTKSHLSYYTDRFMGKIESNVLEIMVDETTEALGKIADESVDVVFLNYSHDYDTLSLLLRIAARKSKRSGIIVIENYIMQDYVTNTPYDIVRSANDFIIEQNWAMMYFILHTGMYCSIAIRRF